ncbi:hypothetical protein Q31b_12880 [Novipirellula aureliae]|uniref:Tetratricopeptide repeat protein n=1 Tax=Novipirellula aureliae TaxID=2527966 RepID=A0A5C6E4C6_9BACT|nr:tetratricopeptide repeat protein [Novipirellula aureliae]TWU43758.1 hypothetical protein Q31b_12880 [Novipirellula aureliae]
MSGSTNTNAPASNHVTAKHSTISRAKVLIAKKDYAAASAILRTASRDYHVLDILAVCLLRSGQTSEAISIYRSFALLPGSAMVRPELGDSCKRNFATAMILHGSPSGGLDLLESCQSRTSERALEIRAAIKAWAKTLSWWRRLDWKLNRIEPQNCVIPISFEPGEFEFELDLAPQQPLEQAVKQASALEIDKARGASMPVPETAENPPEKSSPLSHGV